MEEKEEEKEEEEKKEKEEEEEKRRKRRRGKLGVVQSCTLTCHLDLVRNNVGRTH